ncbi:MAG: membrane protein insertion efficiency factor YidD [Terriglobales bacterium]
MRSFALRLLRLYKRWISPVFPPSCRYTPTCSEYAMEAVERHGALRGGWMAAWRLLRCHPLAKAGLDPVPQTGGRFIPLISNRGVAIPVSTATNPEEMMSN